MVLRFNDILLSAVLMFCVIVQGCSNNEIAKKETEYLIRSGSFIVLKSEFKEELELKKAAYPYNIAQDPAAYNEMVIELVQTLSEEIVILQEAQFKGMDVSIEEIEAAEKDFMKQYPEDSFNQVLLKNAISYNFWKKRFKRQLLIDKMIETDLKDNIKITQEEIVDFYNKKKQENNESNINNEEDLVEQLRLEKTQMQFNDWISKLEQKYPVQINKELLKSVLIGL